MTAYTWIGGTGDWNVAGDWDPAGPPTATDSATISEAGPAYTVTIDSADVAQSLTENSASATVDDIGSLTLGGTFTLSAGTFILGQGGTLSGGTTNLTGGTFACDGGTLKDVTFDGTLDLSESDASVSIAKGTTVNNAAGTGAGTINDTGQYSCIYFENTQTFNNATINLGAASGYSYLNEDDLTGAGTVLTLGSNVTIDESGNAQVETGYRAGDGIVNQGSINQSGTGSYLEIYGTALTNSGTIAGASSGGTLTIATVTFTNSGTLAVSNGDAVWIESSNFSNTGSITLTSGGSLYLDASFTLTELGTVSNSGGTVYIDGTLNLAGGTLNGSSGLGQAVLYGGTVQGGTAKPAGLVLSTLGGTLSDVTYDGTLNLSGDFVSVNLASGTVVNNAAGTGAGTINDTGEGSYLYFDSKQTFNNATINLGATSGYSFLQEYDFMGAGTVLTLGSNVTIDESGSAHITDSGYAGDGIVNQGAIKQSGTSSQLTFYGNSLTNSGTITGASSEGALTIDDATFTNSGTLAVSDGDTVTIEPTTFTNLSGTTLTGGAYTVGAGSILELPDNATIVTDDASITLSGAGSTIQSTNTTTGDQVSFDATLQTVGASGQLYLLSDRSLAAAAAITDNGLIQLGGGTLTVTGTGSSLTLSSTGVLVGFGAVDATTIANSGEIVASGGTLTVDNAIGGSGGVEIEANATLALDASTASSAPATFEGAGATLVLESPASFAGTAGGVGLDDTFDLVGVTANGASVNGSDQLVVTDNGTTVDTVQLSGTNTGFTFLPVSVSGGTDIVSLPTPATVADYLDAVSLYDEIPGGFAIVDTAPNVVAALSTLNADSDVASITVISGSATLSEDAGVNAPIFSETGTGTSLTVAEALGYAGAFSQGAGSTLSISSADTLSLTGTASLSGTTSGLGTLALAGGSATINSGAKLSVSDWSISGSGASVTLGEALTYAGAFSEGAGDTLTLTVGTLTLTGANDAFSGGTVDGSELLYTKGTTAVSGLTIGGTVEWKNANAVKESGGSATIGDASGDEAFLDNAVSGTYDILDNSGIGLGASAASYIDNAGLFEKTGGTGTSVITPAVTNTGTIEVTAGTLDVQRAVTGKGSDEISGASTLEFDSTVATGQTVSFVRSGGTLDLTAPQGFTGQISGFDTVGANDGIEVVSPWVFSGFTENAGGTQGTLGFANGASHHSLTLLGDYNPADFAHQTLSNGSTLITYT
jgi:fibronectin-binding autotransporter adhesin